MEIIRKTASTPCVLGVSNLKHILRATMEPRAVHAIRSGSPQCRLACSHRVDRIQLRGVGLETDTALAASDVVAHCAVVVWSRHLVWMGLLPVHRLALADSRAPWVLIRPHTFSSWSGKSQVSI